MDGENGESEGMKFQAITKTGTGCLLQAINEREAGTFGKGFTDKVADELSVAAKVAGGVLGRLAVFVGEGESSDICLMHPSDV